MTSELATVSCSHLVLFDGIAEIIVICVNSESGLLVALQIQGLSLCVYVYYVHMDYECSMCIYVYMYICVKDGGPLQLSSSAILCSFQEFHFLKPQRCSDMLRSRLGRTECSRV